MLEHIMSNPATTLSNEYLYVTDIKRMGLGCLPKQNDRRAKRSTDGRLSGHKCFQFPFQNSTHFLSLRPLSYISLLREPATKLLDTPLESQDTPVK